MAEIVKTIGREILDSRGNPTVEADVILADGSMGGRRCRPVLPRATMRRSSCVTGTRNAISAKAP